MQQLKSWVSSCRTETILRPLGPLWSFEAIRPRGESISSVVSLNLTQMCNPAKKYVLNLNTCWCCTVPQMIPNCKWSRDRKWSPKRTTNDPSSSLRSAYVFPVVASLPPKNGRPEIRLRFAGYPSSWNESPKNARVGVYPVFPRQIQDIQRRFLV